VTFVLVEERSADDLPRLDRAWAGNETFLLLPAKAGVSKGFVEEALTRLPAELDVDHFLLLTSGSTGEPKLVVGARERANALAATLHDVQESEPVQEAILALPLSYSYSFVNQWRWARLHQRRLVYTTGLTDPTAFRAALRQARDSMLCMVGAQVSLLLRDCTLEPFPGVTRLHFAGGRFPQEHLKALGRLFPAARIFNNYGCAEAMPRLTCRPADAAAEAAHVGWTLPGVEMRSGADEDLLFRSRYGAVGFINSSGFQAITPEDWVPTGDLGVALSDGGWRLTGRRSEVFKRYGERISLPKIAQSLFDAWGGTLAYYRDVDRAGEDGYVLVLSPEPDDSQVHAVLRVLRKEYPRTQWPLRIESATAIPLLPNGKTDSRGLAELSGKREHWRLRI
jgi:acyl-CoA synthetase (AMP-forming)/AMP-acid ligase II